MTTTVVDVRGRTSVFGQGIETSERTREFVPDSRESDDDDEGDRRERLRETRDGGL